MKIIVLIKPVPAEILFDEQGNLSRAKYKNIIGPSDKAALEEAFKIKKENDGEIIAVAMGIKSSVNVLEEAMKMGADRGVLISDNKLAGSDTNATAYILKSLIKKIKTYDLIICGDKSTDSATGQVAVELSAKLDIPFAINVSKLDFIEKNKIECFSSLEAETLKINLKLPALISVTKNINNPHIPTISDILSAKNKKIEIYSAKDLKLNINKCGFLGSPTRVINVEPIEETTKKCVYINGSVENQVKKIIKIINNNLVFKQEESSGFEVIKEKQNCQDVFVYCYEQNGEISNISLRLLAKGYELALKLKVNLVAIHINNSEKNVNKLFHYGANKIILIKNNSQNYHEMSVAVLKIVKKYKPQIILFDKSYNSKIISSFAASKLETGLSADCISLNLDCNSLLVQKRIVYDGKMAVDIICPEKKPQIATTNLSAGIIFNENGQGKLIKFKFKNKSLINVGKIDTEEKNINTKIILSIGAGIQKRETIESIKNIAKKRNYAIGASRRAVDLGLSLPEYQIGITGKTVEPQIYLALGISGSTEHMSGIQNSVIIAINKDKNAKIFKFADYGIIADVSDIILLLEKELEN